jgi:hypothetical protein
MPAPLSEIAIVTQLASAMKVWIAIVGLGNVGVVVMPSSRASMALLSKFIRDLHKKNDPIAM